MIQKGTNFAVLMDVLEASPQDVSMALEADMSLVSRWRTGGRRIMPGRPWVKRMGQVFWQMDAQRPEPVIPHLLHVLRPGEKLEGDQSQLAALMQWLAEPGQMDPDYRRRTMSSLRALVESRPGLRNASLASMLEVQAPADRALRGAQSIERVLEAMQQQLRTTGRSEVILHCPHGLEAFTSGQMTQRIQQRLTRLFNRGLRLTAVLRTDFRISDVAEISGMWFAAHLRGHVQSAYYDDFRKRELEAVEISIDGEAGAELFMTSQSNQWRGMLLFAPQEAARVADRCLQRKAAAVQLLHYRYFRQPGGYFSGVMEYADKPGYLFMQLPQFGILSVGEYAGLYRMEPQESTRLSQEFAQLVRPVPATPGQAPIRHVFSAGAIDSVLSERRSLVYAMTEMCGRRIFLTAQNLITQLKRMRDLMTGNPQYEVCFLEDAYYSKIELQVCSWGDSAVIAWLNGRDSMACKHYVVTAPLHGYCDTVWSRIPLDMRSRVAANKRIDQWLRQARLYGLDA